MRNYTATNTEEKESYSEYKQRKNEGWMKRLKDILIEIKDSSLKEEDKKSVILSMLQKTAINDLNQF